MGAPRQNCIIDRGFATFYVNDFTMEIVHTSDEYKEQTERHPVKQHSIIIFK
jgi:hypothetical protein